MGAISSVRGVNEVFRKMDHLLFSALWRWSRRRHPNKGRRWVKRRYFRKEGSRDWVFAREGFRLLRFSDFSYREHFKIKSEANPDDPSWEHYFAQRQAKQGTVLRGGDGREAGPSPDC